MNAELNRGTLTRILAQPIHRDYLLNAKFTGALMLIGTLFFCLSFLVMGLGLIIIGIPPTADEFLRIIFFTILNIFYVAFWLNLSILFSVRFRQAATSALTSIAVWLFFTVFYQIIINLFGRMLISPDSSASQEFSYRELIRNLLTFSPSRLYRDASATLLLPSVRSLGPLTLEKMVGAIPGPLPAGQSLLLVWPQLTGLIAATVLCFALSYYSFMKKRSGPAKHSIPAAPSGRHNGMYQNRTAPVSEMIFFIFRSQLSRCKSAKWIFGILLVPF